MKSGLLSTRYRTVDPLCRVLRNPKLKLSLSLSLALLHLIKGRWDIGN